MDRLLLRQMFEKESSTYTYLLADVLDPNHECVLIDPVDLTAARDAEIIRELGLKPTLLLNTHVHADHITGTGVLKEQHFPRAKSVLSTLSTGKADVHVNHKDKLPLGLAFELHVRSTPGHTAGCVSYVLLHQKQPLMVFTGDALLIRGCGRTDFQEGDARVLYRSVHSELLTLPDEVLVYPAHDYHGRTVSTIGEERVHNPRLSKTEHEFVNLMHQLNLPYPSKIDVALPRNLKCGAYDLE
eukprot:CAMPEP_0185849912 /NCGR_PEP_ID=MMETSP1354-20130828/4246_1 /TAXON_ID=708628 /ORGANISM="Erythrolobus madagascarensis, Strain CCMP3276" /LENGTH=241 /DNA_ID=CAMNT_0028550521 /DNA_START=210 /DNA_END=935 /DNA_ORIENTATION=+